MFCGLHATWRRPKSGAKISYPYAEARYGFGHDTTDAIAVCGLDAVNGDSPFLQFHADRFPVEINRKSIKELMLRQLARFGYENAAAALLHFRIHVNSLANRFERIHWMLVTSEKAPEVPHIQEYPEKLLTTLQDWACAFLDEERSTLRKPIRLDTPEVLRNDSQIEFTFRYGMLSQWLAGDTGSPIKRLAGFLSLQKPSSNAKFMIKFPGKQLREGASIRINSIDDADWSCIYKITRFDRIEIVPLSEKADANSLVAELWKHLSRNQWASTIQIQRGDASTSVIFRE